MVDKERQTLLGEFFSIENERQSTLEEFWNED